MDKDIKETILQGLIICGLILLSLLVMYFSYKQSRSYYYDADGNPKKEMQKMFDRKNVS